MTAATTSLRLLLVQSSDPDAELLTEALSLTGEPILVQHVTNGHAALRYALEGTDLILLAAHLPGMDGFEVLKAIKANPQTRTLPVLVLDAASASEIRQAFDLEADEVLSQGANFSDVQRLVQQVLRFCGRDS